MCTTLLALLKSGTRFLSLPTQLRSRDSLAPRHKWCNGSAPGGSGALRTGGRCPQLVHLDALAQRRSLRMQLLLSFGLLVVLVLSAFVGIWAASVFLLRASLVNDSKKALLQQISVIGARLVSEVCTPRQICRPLLASRRDPSDQMPTSCAECRLLQGRLCAQEPSLTLFACRLGMYSRQNSMWRPRPSCTPSPLASSMRMTPRPPCLSSRSRAMQAAAFRDAPQQQIACARASVSIRAQGKHFGAGRHRPFRTPSATTTMVNTNRN